MTAAVPAPQANMGQPIPRTEARAKVTGAARYASDMPVLNPAYAVLVTSTIAKGRIVGIDDSAARAVPGADRRVPSAPGASNSRPAAARVESWCEA